MTPIPDDDDIIGRVERATGGDRLLDRWLEYTFNIQRGAGGYDSGEDWVAAATNFNWATPFYTSSIDAALALVERKLPDWTAWELYSSGAKKHFTCRLSRLTGQLSDRGYEQMEAGHAPTPPLAIIRALLHALRSQPQSSGELYT